MIFDSLEEAFDDFKTFASYNVDTFIKGYHIDLQCTDALPDNIDGYSLPLTRTMFINVYSNNQPFVKHHELIHCLLDDSVEPLIETSYVSGSKIERRANAGALAIMIGEYVRDLVIEPDEFNLIKFQHYYNLPAIYLYDAANMAEKILGIKIDV